MITLIYAAIAVAFLLAVLALYSRTRSHDIEASAPDFQALPAIGNKRLLDLSERIFDPSDARWLSEELAFPKLAEALAVRRKRIAIRCLEALRASFDEVVRTPALTYGELSEANSADSWRMLWLTLRFRLLVSYALFLVKLWGPYHRLIPSFARFPLPLFGRLAVERPAMANSRVYR